MKDDIKIKYSSAFATAHSRDYYRGKSFRNAGAWTAGEHYTCDEYNVDFVYYKNIFLACTKSHLAKTEIEPSDWIYDEDGEVIGVNSEYWTLVVAGRKGDKGKVYIPHYDNTTGILTWNLISDEQAVPTVDFDLELTAIINAAVEAANAATEDALAATSNANDAASSAHDAAEAANNAAEDARSIISDIEHILDGIIAQVPGQGTTVVMSQKATTDELNKKADKLITFTVDNIMTVGAGGNLKDSGISKTAITDLQTNVTNLQDIISGSDGVLDDITAITARLSQLNYAYTGKGTKPTASALPSSGNHEGDVWKVLDTNAHYVWTGSEWDKLSENIDLTPYITASQIASTYLSKTDAANIYLTKTEASNTYITSHQNIYALTLKYGDQAAVTFNPKQAAASFIISPSSLTISIENGTSITYNPSTGNKSITIPAGGGSGPAPDLSNYVTLTTDQTISGKKNLKKVGLLCTPHEAPNSADLISGETYLWIDTTGNYSGSPSMMNISTQAPDRTPLTNEAYLYYDASTHQLCVKEDNGTVYKITLTAS